MCMYKTNLRADQTQLPLQSIYAVTMTENGDWRSKLQPHTRLKIVNKIMETLQRRFPFPEQKGLFELKKIAERFEENNYTGATSQSDYLRKISLKMLEIETKFQPLLGNAMQPNAGTTNQNPADSGSGGIQAQVHNQAQQLPMPTMGNQSQARQLLPQSIQNNMESTLIQNSASLTTAPPSAVGMTLASIPNVNGQNSNLQNISNVAQNSMANSMVQGMPSNMFANTQPHMLGRQQEVVSQQKSQNPQHYLYQPLLQHQLLSQQENLSSMRQQQISKQQQHHFIGLQSNNSGVPSNQQNLHMLQQARITAQQPLQQSTGFIPTQGQQTQQMQLPQQQLMPHIQSQIAQLQQQIVSLQQHPTLQTSSSLLHQNVVDLQKQMSQLQMQIPDEPSSSLDSIAQTGSVHGGDWQEDAYQKIRSMKEMYFVQLNELYQRLKIKIQLHSISQQPKNEPLEKLKVFKALLEKLLQFLRLNKNDIQIAHKEKIGPWEKQIVKILKSYKPRKHVSSLPQGQLPQSRMHELQQNPQSQSQICQMQTHESQMSSQLQSSMKQGSVVPMQQNNLAHFQHNWSSASNISNPQQNMVNYLQSDSGLGLDATHGNAQSSLQQVALGSIQQNPINCLQQMNMNPLSSQSGMNTMPSNFNPLQQNSNMIPQLMHQQQQLQQLFLRRQLQQQQQQQLFLRRQLQQQQQKQQPAQLPSHNMSQILQMNEGSDINMLQQSGVKSGILQQHHPAGQCSDHHPQLKSGILLSSPSHQVTQHLSPQIDQQNMPTSVPKDGTPLQSSSSPYIVPSPSTPLAPSPMLVETEKINTDVLPLTDTFVDGLYLFTYLLGLLGFLHLLLELI